MLLIDARSRLRIDLADLDEARLTENDVDRAIQRAVADLSRFLPLDAVYEVVLTFTVTDEAWTSAAAAGTYVSLDNKPIKYDSETVKNAAGTECVRNTDYYMNYLEGKITHISGGAIGNDESCTISYTKSRTTVDLSSIASDLIRVDRVEYPLGNIPQEFVTCDIWGDLLTVTGSYDTQAELSENKHLGIYYKSKHTPPTMTAEGTYPSFLDDTISLAASAYALFGLVGKYNFQALTDLASARTALEAISHTAVGTSLTKAAASIALATTALGKVDTYVAGATAPSAKKYLQDGDDKVAAISLTVAKGYLTSGVPFIDLPNKGSNVAENYGSYGRVAAEQELVIARQATMYNEYAGRSTEIALTFIQEALQRNSAADSYTRVAIERNATIDRYLAEVDRYATTAMQSLSIAERLRVEAVERRNEAWAIWRDPKQYVGDWTISQLRQPVSE